MHLVSYVSSIYLFILDLALEIGIAGAYWNNVQDTDFKWSAQEVT